MSDEKPMGQVIQIDEARIRDHLGEMVRGTVEETLNAMLDAEADQLCGAGRYERSEARQDTRAGSYERTLQTGAGEVNLKVPKLRRQTFETAIIERYRRRESSVESADRDVSGGDFGPARGRHHRSALGDAREPEHGVEPEQKDLRQDRGLAKPAHRRRASVSLSRRHRDEAQLGRRGSQRLPAGGQRRQCRGWSAFLRHLVDRPQGSAAAHFRCLPRPGGECRGVSTRSQWQRSMVHFRNVFSHVPTRVREVSHMLKAIHAQERQAAAGQKAQSDHRGSSCRQDEQGSRPRRAECPRDIDPLRPSRHPLAENQDQQSVGADNAGVSPPDPRRWGVPRRPVLPQPGHRTSALHRSCKPGAVARSNGANEPGHYLEATKSSDATRRTSS